jgi:peptidoglycan-associated lipoprotein
MSLRFDKSPAQLFRKVVLSLAIMIIVFGVNTGCSPKFKEAKTLFDQGYYGQAAVTFEEVSKRDKDKKIKDTAVFWAAESYRLNNDYDKAKKLYDKVLKKDPLNAQALLMRANMLKKMELYREAMDAYKKYLEVAKEKADTSVEIKKAGCELALRWTPDSSLFKVEEFKAANTKANDWAPMIAAKKDNLVFFASDREGGFSKRIYGGTMQMWSDIWYVEGKESKVSDTKKKSKKVSVVKWNKPVYAEKNSSKWNEGGLTFDNKFSVMYVTQCGGEDGKTEKCGIYSYKKTGVDWNLGEALDICKEDTGHSYGHPAYGLDDKILYFSSDRLGGFGGFDIWAITYSKRSKNWGAPINLGPDINTSGNEYFPYFNKHDKRLYFSSDGWPTLGGLDINAADVTNDITKWRDRENMREPLNSGGDDFGITFYEGKSTKGFFTSNRGKKNDDDIYAFDVVPLVITIRGVVTDCNTNKPLSGATVMISNDKDTSVMVLKANERGEYQATLNPKTNYELLAKYPELYYFEKPPVNRTTHGIRFSKELIQDFCMENPLDKIYTLPIFYDLDSANIRPDAARILDTFAQEVLIRYPRLIAELGSHTDCRASVEYNTRLAQRRADSAKVYLLRKYKIDTARIHAVGFGEKELINDCKCEGAEKAGFTPYRQDTTRKMVIVKDAKGNVIKSYYENYKPNELTKIDGKFFVPCDEFQHQQNRRTTVRFEWGNQKSRAKINQDVDANNSNKGAESKKKEEAAKLLATNPDLDLTNAIRLRIAMQDSTKMISIMIANKEAKAFAFDFKGKLTAVPSEVAAEWFEKDIIVKKDFVDGEKIKVGKVKLPSNKFVVEEVMVGDYLVKGVQFTVSDKVSVPTLGKSFFGKTFKEDSFISGSELVLIPKKAAKKPKAKKEDKKEDKKDGEETSPENK